MKIIIKFTNYLVMFGFQFVIALFFKFHIDLVFSNTTTIETLEKEKLGKSTESLFDIGFKENFE